MGKKWIMKYIKILFVISSLCLVFFILIVNYLFSDNRFNTPEIYYDIEESVLNSSKSEGVIARDVYGIYEIANKIFYITSCKGLKILLGRKNFDKRRIVRPIK